MKKNIHPLLLEIAQYLETVQNPILPNITRAVNIGTFAYMNRIACNENEQTHEFHQFYEENCDYPFCRVWITSEGYIKGVVRLGESGCGEMNTPTIKVCDAQEFAEFQEWLKTNYDENEKWNCAVEGVISPVTKIKAVRLAKGYSRMALACATSIPYRTLENWEEGKTPCPPYIERFILMLLEGTLGDPDPDYSQLKARIAEAEESISTALQQIKELKKLLPQ